MKEYCVCCGKEREYSIEDKQFKVINDNQEICYLGKTAKCKHCSSEILTDEIENYNQKEFEKSFVQKNEIITIEEIKDILNKYRIGKRPLSVILEFGEITLTRYLDGYLPSRKNSKLLKAIKNNPELYYDYLTKNKDKISVVAFKKSKNAVEEILGIYENDTLLEDVAEYILNHNAETTPLVLQKLLYYVEFLYLMFCEKPLFKSDCGAWDHGPVYGKIYYLFKSYGNTPIELEERNCNLNEQLLPMVNEIIKNFGCYSGNVLSFFTHRETPWKLAREEKRETIDKSALLDYVLKVKEEYKIQCIKDIKQYSLAMFEQYQKAQSERFQG